MKKFSMPFVLLVAVYGVALTISNIIAGKLYLLGNDIVLTSAVWLFPVVYIIGDVVPEVYGLATARKVILIGFLCNLIAVLFFGLTLALPYPGFWTNQQAFDVVLGFTPRLLAASFTAYLIGTNVNAAIMVAVKRLTNEKYLWIRTIVSTVFGEGIDSLVFISLAFFGIVPTSALVTMVLAQASFKIAYEVVATPLTYIVVGWFKKYELANQE